MDDDREFTSFLDLIGSGSINPSINQSAIMEEAAPSNAPSQVGDAENPVQVDGTALMKRKVGARKRVRPGTSREKKSNFSTLEDVLVAKSWLKIACDQLINTGQKRDKFWDRIVAQYNSMRGAAPERTLCSLQSRWDIIKAESSKYSEYYFDAVRVNPSGMTDSDKVSCKWLVYIDSSNTTA